LQKKKKKVVIFSSEPINKMRGLLHNRSVGRRQSQGSRSGPVSPQDLPGQQEKRR
jgi:hypothetical protein